jgi:hypothetical protein
VQPLRDIGWIGNDSVNGLLYDVFERTEESRLWSSARPCGLAWRTGFTGVKKVTGPLLSPGALDFMPISRSRVIRENHARQTIIKIPVERIRK